MENNDSVEENYDPGLVIYLVEKGNYKIPYKALKTAFIAKLNKILETGNPLALHDFFSNCSGDIDNIIDKNSLQELVQEINTKYGEIIVHTSSDDNKIIDFFSSIERMPLENFLDVSGSIIFISDVVEDLEEHKDNIPKSVRVACLLWAYVSLYELMTNEIFQRLMVHLKESSTEIKNKKALVKLLEKYENSKGHETAGRLNTVLSSVIPSLQRKNESIFGSDEDSPKKLRDCISHSTIFYDSERDKLVSIQGREYGIEELKTEFSLLFAFCAELMQKSIKETPVDDIINDIRKQLLWMGQEFLKIERSGEMRRRLGELVITWKKESKK